MRVVVASTNPVKLAAVAGAFAEAFPGEPLDLRQVFVASGVPDQPSCDEETLRGALGRVAAARDEVEAADYWVGVEGGVEERGSGMFAFAWVAVADRARTSTSRTASFALPPEVARLVRSGVELGEADDRVFGLHESKRAQGAVGLLTHGRLDRRALYQPAVLLALVPFLNPTLFQGAPGPDP